MIGNRMKTCNVAVRKASEIKGDPTRWTEKDLRVVKRHLDEILLLINIKYGFFKNKQVLIHPNLVRPNPEFNPASFTDPRIILAFVQLLSDHGAQKIMVGENPGYEYSAKHAFSAAGLTKSLKKLGAEACYFDEGEWVDVENDKGVLFRKIRVAKPVLDSDVFINLPKMKTHMLTQVSLCIKNLLGIIPDNLRMMFHRNDIIHKIVDLAMVRPPDLNVVDGLWAMEGQAPFHGSVIRDFNCMLAGTDLTAVDCVAAKIMGFEIREIPHLALAVRQLWKDEDPIISIVGDSLDSVKRSFQRPVLSSVAQFPGIECIECGVCNGCLSAIRHSLDKINHEAGFDEYPSVTIVSGLPMPNMLTLEQWSHPLILFGNCAAGFQFYESGQRANALWIPGCPPHVLDLMKLLDRLRKGSA